MEAIGDEMRYLGIEEDFARRMPAVTHPLRQRRISMKSNILSLFSEHPPAVRQELFDPAKASKNVTLPAP